MASPITMIFLKHQYQPANTLIITIIINILYQLEYHVDIKGSFISSLRITKIFQDDDRRSWREPCPHTPYKY